jgi:hypothetical protein
MRGEGVGHAEQLVRKKRHHRRRGGEMRVKMGNRLAQENVPQISCLQKTPENRQPKMNCSL